MPDKSMMLLEKMMDVSAYRQRLLASNVANIDTPNYKAKDISFQKELDSAVSEAAAGGKGVKHKFEVFESPSSLLSRDGNTVSLDMEMAKVGENSMIFSTAAQLLSMKVRMMKDAIKGGR
ncbi:MAG: flagellar basal body rod protein FlgB [Nitrospirae bacterium]|nr:MAG: flagellar basal body rod protein FlgB [Nitrospirota bacterium]